MKALVGFGVGLVLLAGAAALVIYTGAYDVSVKSGHSAGLEKTLGLVAQRSIRAQAHGILPPGGLDFQSAELLEKAAGHYEAMCRTCHGAPGRKADPWLLYPPAPDLVAALPTRSWSDAELFWIIKHGIKDTAMGAFGGTHAGAHSDDDLWGLTALLRQFSTLSPEQYRSMAARARARPDGTTSICRRPPSTSMRPSASERTRPKRASRTGRDRTRTPPFASSDESLLARLAGIRWTRGERPTCGTATRAMAKRQGTEHLPAP